MTRMKRGVLALTLLVATGLVATIAAQQTSSYDLLIRNGRVLDGTGNPWFPADVGVREGRIVAVGVLKDATAARVIDAAGKYVSLRLHRHPLACRRRVESAWRIS